MNTLRNDDIPVMDIAGTVARLEAKARAARQPEQQSEQAALADRIRARLAFLTGSDSTGQPRVARVTPEACRLVATSVGRAPVVDGHRGTASAAEKAEAFVRDTGIATVVFCGPPGVGKSTAAAWIVAEHMSGVWLSVDDVRPSAEWDARRRGLLHCALLVVDDLGCETTSFASGELSSVLERRHDGGKRTVITTNLLFRPDDVQRIPEALRRHFPAGHTVSERYGERVASRLSDSRALRAWLGGNDLRRTTR